MLLAERRQDAAEQHADAELGGLHAHLLDALLELLVHARQAAPAELLRREVELEVELPELGREALGGERLEQRQRGLDRAQPAVDQEHLLLGPDAPHAALDLTSLEHDLERAHVLEQGAHEAAHLALADAVLDLVLAHARVE